MLAAEQVDVPAMDQLLHKMPEYFDVALAHQAHNKRKHSPFGEFHLHNRDCALKIAADAAAEPFDATMSHDLDDCGHFLPLAHISPSLPLCCFDST